MRPTAAKVMSALPTPTPLPHAPGLRAFLTPSQSSNGCRVTLHQVGDSSSSRRVHSQLSFRATTLTDLAPLIAVVGTLCWPDRNLYGRDMRSTFWASKTLSPIDCFARCLMVSGCTFSAYKEDTADPLYNRFGGGSCYLRSDAETCSGSTCGGSTGEGYPALFREGSGWAAVKG